jgi:NitT/TauT family transport system substrate-binding protein
MSRWQSGLLSVMAAAMLALVPLVAHAEVSELHIPLGAGGFGFLPLYMMQKYHLIEKHAAAEGIKVKVDWPNIGGPAVMNDALLSGSADFIAAGPPAFLVLWDRTRTNVRVKGIAAMSSMPMLLNARVAELASLDAIRPHQKIAVTSVKVSIPSIIMQIYSARRYGMAQAFRFDPNTVTMTHPDALISLLSGRAGSANIVAHWASAPFGQRELMDPRIRTLMNSDDIMGGPTTFTMLSTTTRFHDRNPRICAAVLAALEEAEKMIAANPRNAAAVLLDSMGGSGWKLDELLAILADPHTQYTTRPQNVLKYASFMQAAGSLRSRPATLSDLFFSSPAIAGGN